MFAMKLLYALLAVLGTVVPLSQFTPWLVEHGLDFSLLFQQAFEPNIAAFAWLDGIASAVALLIFIFWEGRRLNLQKLWVPVLGTCTVGVSLGLPLFLLMREIKLQNNRWGIVWLWPRHDYRWPLANCTVTVCSRPKADVSENSWEQFLRYHTVLKMNALPSYVAFLFIWKSPSVKLQMTFFQKLNPSAFWEATHTSHLPFIWENAYSANLVPSEFLFFLELYKIQPWSCLKK